MKPIYFVLLWLFSIFLWGVFIFVSYSVVPFSSMLEYIYENHPDIIGDDIWDNYIVELSLCVGGFLNCVLIYCIARVFFRKTRI
uniref:Uncharacterized protein n=1 Tax=Edwardsiella tarda TaxID=636 RepID=A0A2S1PMG5_EDWTA|nr:hypothetical protein [Edwardsiella tarda]